jgi:hypothetical protein
MHVDGWKERTAGEVVISRLSGRPYRFHGDARRTEFSQRCTQRLGFYWQDGGGWKRMEEASR